MMQNAFTVGLGHTTEARCALVDEVYDAVHVDGDDDGLLDGMANLAEEFVGSEHAFLQGGSPKKSAKKRIFS